MSKIKILNLYAGVGGNRKLWDKIGLDVEITSVELDDSICQLYKELYPNDNIYQDDAHQYLLDNYKEFDFIWSSPPCQSHSKMIRSGRNRKPIYPDMRLYEEILLLEYDFKGSYVVENVKPYYGELIKAQKVGRHLFWSDLDLSMIQDRKRPTNFINKTTVEGKKQLQNWLGIYYDKNVYYGNNHCPAQILRNCVHPHIGGQILAQYNKQKVGD